MAACRSVDDGVYAEENELTAASEVTKTEIETIVFAVGTSY